MIIELITTLFLVTSLIHYDHSVAPLEERIEVQFLPEAESLS